jgi:hypothetical protein
MLEKKYVPQDIQAYFSRPTRSINHVSISEVWDGTKHKAVGSFDSHLFKQLGSVPREVTGSAVIGSGGLKEV